MSPKKIILLVVVLTLSITAIWVGVVVRPMVFQIFGVRFGPTTVISGPAWVHMVEPQFSPDGRWFAYVWHDVTYRSGPQKVVAHVRWFPVDDRSQERSASLDFLDYGSKMDSSYHLGAKLQFAPNSAYLAAVSPRWLCLIDLRTGQAEQIQFAGEYFGGLAWSSHEEISYSTTDGRFWRFWRHRLGEPPTRRELVYEYRRTDEARRISPIESGLRKDIWSPNGRYVVFSGWDSEGPPPGILDLNEGTVQPLPLDVVDASWKRDSSAVCVGGWERPSGEDRLLLVDIPAGRSSDLTHNLEKFFGRVVDRLAFPSPYWLSEATCLVQVGLAGDYVGRSCLIRLRPFNVVFAREGSMAWSPYPGWVFAGRGYLLNYAEMKEKPVKTHALDVTWSPDGRHAAETRDHEMVVFDVAPPVDE